MFKLINAKNEKKKIKQNKYFFLDHYLRNKTSIFILLEKIDISHEFSRKLDILLVLEAMTSEISMSCAVR